MPTWIPIVAVILAVIAFGAFNERRRIKKLEDWAQQRGLEVLCPFAPDPSDSIFQSAKRFNAHGARVWGVALKGQINGHEVLIAEQETTRAGSMTRGNWYTLIQFAVGVDTEPVIFWPKTGVMPISDARVADRLGVPDADPKTLRTVTENGLLVETAALRNAAQRFASQLRALEQWPHGGAVACERGSAVWRTRGLLSSSKLEERLAAALALQEIFSAGSTSSHMTGKPVTLGKNAGVDVTERHAILRT